MCLLYHLFWSSLTALRDFLQFLQLQPPKPHNVVATTEEGRRLPFPVLQEIYEAYFWFFKRCEEYFLCKYQPPEGVKSVGDHVELEIRLYLERFPPQQRYLRRLIFDYLLKRECCITGLFCHFIIVLSTSTDLKIDSANS